MADTQRSATPLEGRPWPDAPRQPAGKGRERKVVTAMFVDIVRSSAMVAGRDPEDVDDLLLAILTRLTDAVPRYGGLVAQLLGDGFVAMFGAPDAREDHALRACLAAQDILSAPRGLGDGAGRDAAPPPFQIRVGISSGEAVAHVVTNGLWTDYRAVGECVHMAAKLQQRAAADTAQLSRDTLDLIPVGVTARPMGMIQLSEAVEPTPAFLLDGARAVRRTATDLLSATDAPCVGREREVAALFANADAVETGAPRLLMLCGDAGIGKSRLVGEFLRAPRSRRWTLLQWPQMPIRRLADPDDLEAVALSLAEQVAGSACDAGIDWVCDAAERRVGAREGKAAGALAGDAVRVLFGRPALSNRLWSGLDPGHQLSLGIDGLVGAVMELASPARMPGRPLLALVEDAHWARPVMVRLLDRLAKAMPGSGASLLLLATRRPPPLGAESDAPGWSGPPGAARIDLSSLASSQVQAFMDHWLGTDWSLADLKAQVAARCEGVPLYLEEVLRALEAANAIEGTPGAYRLNDPEAVHRLPLSLRSLLGERMDLLDPKRRDILLNAAVIGTTFDVELLRALTDGAADGLGDHLDYLELTGFVQGTRLLPNKEFAFKHALIQENAYETQTRESRRALHARVLDALRHRRDENLPNRMGLLAHHAFAAENWPSAYLFGRRAGVRAELRSKLEEAGRHYDSALQALNRMPPAPATAARCIDLSIATARSRLPRGIRNPGDHLERALERARSIGDQRRYARVSSIMAAFEWSYGDIDRAIAFSRDGLRAIDGIFDLRTHVQILARLGGILAEKGRFDEGRDALVAARSMLPEARNPERFGLAVIGHVGVLSNLARSAAELGRAEEALANAAAAVEAAERSNHNFSKVYAYEYLGWVHLLLDQPDRAVPALEQALDLCAMVQVRLHKPFIEGALGYALFRQGDAGRSATLFERCFSAVGTPEAGELHVSLLPVYLWCAEMRMHERPDDARALIERIQATAKRTGRIAYLANALALGAEAALNAGERGASVEIPLRQAETIARSIHLPRITALCDAIHAKGEARRAGAAASAPVQAVSA